MRLEVQALIHLLNGVIKDPGKSFFPSLPSSSLGCLFVSLEDCCKMTAAVLDIVLPPKPGGGVPTVSPSHKPSGTLPSRRTESHSYPKAGTMFSEM